MPFHVIVFNTALCSIKSTLCETNNIILAKTIEN